MENFVYQDHSVDNCDPPDVEETTVFSVKRRRCDLVETRPE